MIFILFIFSSYDLHKKDRESQCSTNDWQTQWITILWEICPFNQTLKGLLKLQTAGFSLFMPHLLCIVCLVYQVCFKTMIIILRCSQMSNFPWGHYESFLEYLKLHSNDHDHENTVSSFDHLVLWNETHFKQLKFKYSPNCFVCLQSFARRLKYHKWVSLHLTR